MCAKRTPFLPNSSIICGVILAGTAIIPKSIGGSSGKEEIEPYTLNPSISSPSYFGLTG